MTDLESTLDGMRARVDAATEGPWEVSTKNRRRSALVRAENGLMIEHYARPHDAIFIAHARTDMPALLAAVDAVVALHTPYNLQRDYGQDKDVCSECADGGPCGREFIDYPCPTIRALTTALGVER